MRRLVGSLIIASHLPGQRKAPFLPRERVEAVRDRRVRRIVTHAVATVPSYRELFAREGWSARDIRGAADLDRLPIVDRDAVWCDPAPVPVRIRARPRVTWPADERLDRHAARDPPRPPVDPRDIAWGERERAPMIALSGGSFRPRELHIGYETSNFRKILAFHASHALMPVKPRRDALSMTSPFDEIADAINRVRRTS